jgi:hypothetical protein
VFCSDAVAVTQRVDGWRSKRDGEEVLYFFGHLYLILFLK